MKHLFTTISFLTVLGLSSLFAQFEGIIEFDKIKAETTRYSYAVKGDKVRIEETSPDGEIKGIMIIDLTKEKVTALSPERKLYMDATNKRIAPAIKPEINKTKNTKKIQGYNCTEWIVKYGAEDTEISYWVTPSGEFDFFNKMLVVLNRKDKLSKYFLSVPGHEDMFTLDGVEKTIDGSIRTELRITSIEKKTLEDKLFTIPKEYQQFER
jgi:hypothetical protein